MADLFLKILNTSLSAGWLILAVVALRLLLRKAPRWIHVLLWGLVAVRLLCPVSLESMLSLIPSKQVVSPSIMLDAQPQIHSGLEFINSAVNPILSESFSPNPGDSANPLQIWIPVGAALWLLGTAALLGWGTFSYLRLKKQVRDARLLKDKIYVSHKVSTPFLLGFFRPRIYLPLGMPEDMQASVIAHELSHIRRKDHWWKPLGYCLLALHWFNPLMWLGYGLLCRDIEMACDEKAVAKMERQQRADYSQALLQCSISRRSITVCPLAFGEVSVKQRIRSVLNYKKPGFWIVVISLVLCAVLAVCFLTDPKEEFPTFQNKQLAVWTQEGELSQWNFYEILPSDAITLPGNANATFTVKEVTENGIWLRFEPKLMLDGKSIRELFLKASDQRTLMLSSSAGMIRFVFSVVDNDTIGENGIGVMENYSPLEGMPLTYTPEQAQKDGCVVMVNGDVASGKDLWWNFYVAAQAGTPSGIRIMEYYEGSLLAQADPVFYLRDVTFDGKAYHVRWFEDVTEYSRDYTYLLRFQNAAESEKAEYKSYDRYVLTNDNSLTWKQIWNEMLSPFALPGVTDHLTVFTDLIYPTDPGYGTLMDIKAALHSQMIPLKIASLEVNNALMTLDVSIYEVVDGLEETLYSYLDPKFVRIIQLEGEYKKPLDRVIYLDEVLTFSKGENPGLLLELWDLTFRQVNDFDDDGYLQTDRAYFDVWLDESHTRNYFLITVLDLDMYELEHIYLSNRSWLADVMREDLEAFLAGWEAQEPDTVLTEEEEKQLNGLLETLCADAADVDAAIQANPEAYDQILSYGKKALWWAMEELHFNYLSDLSGDIRGKICRDIMASWGEVYEMEEWYYTSGELWIGQLNLIANQMQNEYTAFYIRDNHPGVWMLLNMTRG